MFICCGSKQKKDQKLVKPKLNPPKNIYNLYSSVPKLQSISQSTILIRRISGLQKSIQVKSET